MTHDEMCPLFDCDEPNPFGVCRCDYGHGTCQCDLIRKVRDAQREQDAGIVERLKWTMDPFDEAAKAIREGR